MQKRDGLQLLVIFTLAFFLSLNVFSAVPDVLRESFDYSDGDLLGQGESGNGWLGPWEEPTQGNVLVLSGSMGYEGIPQQGGYLEVSEAGTIWRLLEETWPDDGTTYWISLLYERFDGHDVDASYNGFSLFSGASTELLYIGKPWNYTTIGMDAHRATGAVGTEIDAYSTNWIVIKLVMDGTAENDRAYLWVNPDPAVEPDTTLADTVAYWEGSNGFDRVRIGSGDDPTPCECFYDEICFSKSYAGLTGEAPSPGVLPDPVLFFDFEETEGFVCQDQGTAGNNGEIIGDWIDRVDEGIITKPGESGRSIEFTEQDGFGQLSYVLVPYLDALNSTDYTISTWMLYTGEAPNWGYLFWADGEVWEPPVVDRHIDVWLHPYNNESLGVDCILHLMDESELRVANDVAETGIDLMDGDWHQVTCVLRENIVYGIYIDGLLAAEGEGTDEVVENEGDDLWLGARPNDVDAVTSVKLVGLMDRVRYWDQALTDEQIEYLFLMEGPTGGSVGVKEAVSAPTDFALKGNYPNPFNPVTTIHYSLDRTEQVTLEIYDLLGHKVRTLVSGLQESGEYQVQWNGTSEAGQPLSSGVYLYRLVSGNRVESRKMMLLK